MNKGSTNALTHNAASKRRSVNPFQAIGLVAMFLVLSMVGGILTAALVVPVAAGASTATKTATDTFNEIPSVLDIVAPAQASKIYASDGKTLLATYYSENRLVVPLSEISMNLQNAVIATEDKRFWSHGGVDIQGITRAALQQVSGKGGGGSTLTQQYVKNALIQKASRDGDLAGVEKAKEDAIERKMREAKLALHVEKTMSKEEILEGYLNIAQFGIKVYGAETAANYYFGKKAKDLSIVEAATIAGITQLPGKFDPTSKPEENQRRRNVVLMLMYQQGYITNAEYQEAVATKVEDTLNVQKLTNGCEAAGRNGFFCDYVTKTIIQNPVFGETVAERKELLYRGGLKIVTTLDVAAQKDAYVILRDTVPADNKYNIASALTAVEPGTGKIKVMAQNRQYNPSNTKKEGFTSVNYSAPFEYGGSRGFQVGSTFKAFVLAEWLKEGHTLNETVSADLKTWWPGDFDTGTCTGNGPYGRDGWTPRNSDGRASGRRSALQATSTSVNTAFVAMESQLNICKLAKTAEDIGFRPSDPADEGKIDVKPAMVLGTQSSSPLIMASAFATFANGGVYCEPIAIESVTDASGEKLKVPEANCRQTLDTETTKGVNHALASVISAGGGAAKSALKGGRPAAGKTGTTNDNGDAWFVGYTPQLSTAVWMGDPDTKQAMDRVRLNGRYYGRIYGSTMAAPIWKKFMDKALADLPKEKFPTVSKNVLGEREKTDAEIEAEAKKKAEEEAKKKAEEEAKNNPSPSTPEAPPQGGGDQDGGRPNNGGGGGNGNGNGGRDG